MDYTDWHLKNPWKVKLIHKNPDADVTDEVSFTPATGTLFTLSSVICTHGTAHGSIWNGVVCTGDPMNPNIARGMTNVVPTLPLLSSKPFVITSSKPGAKEELTAEISIENPIGGACWTADEGP